VTVNDLLKETEKETEPAIATEIGRDLQRRTKIATVTARETETEIAAEKRKWTEIALAPDGVPQACSTSTAMSQLLAIEVALLVDDCGLQSGQTSGLGVLSK
jgi:uncharacterized metal-binding protein